MGHFCGFIHASRAIPSDDSISSPTVLMTLQKHLRTSDHYSGLYFMLTRDLGRTWSEPELRSELDWVRDGEVNVAVADVTPVWAPVSRRVVAVGAQVRYSLDGRQLEDRPRAHQTAYALFDPATERWTAWKRLEMPQDDSFEFARCACAQFLCEASDSATSPKRAIRFSFHCTSPSRPTSRLRSQLHAARWKATN